MSNPFEEILTLLFQIKEAIDASKTTPNNKDEIIDRPELLRRLNITEPTAIRWGKAGRIPEIRVGSQVRYNWPKVVEQLEKIKK